MTSKIEHVQAKELGLTIVAIIASGVSVNFLIFGTLGLVNVIDYRNYALIPSVVIIVAIAVYSRFAAKRLSNRLITGIWVGAVCTFALEAIRIPGYLYFHWLPGDDMVTLPGILLTGMAGSLMEIMQMMQASGGVMQPPIDVITVGTLYHFWNGATFGAVYAMFVGKGRWYYGLLWGFVIHWGMMLAPWLVMMFNPLGISYLQGYNIFTISLLAHIAYGSALGIGVQRFVKHEGSLLKLLVRETAK